MPKIKIQDYKLAWSGEINKKTRTLWIINPQTDNLRLWVWGMNFPYHVGETIEGEIKEQARTKPNGETYINKIFIPQKSNQAREINQLREFLSRINLNLNAIKEIQTRNEKLLEATKEQLNNLSKLLYEKEFEKQLEDLSSNGGND